MHIPGDTLLFSFTDTKALSQCNTIKQYGKIIKQTLSTTKC